RGPTRPQGARFGFGSGAHKCHNRADWGQDRGGERAEQGDHVPHRAAGGASMITMPKLPAIAQARLQTVGLAYLGVSGVAAATLLGVMLFTSVGESIQQIVRLPVDQILNLIGAQVGSPQVAVTAETSPSVAADSVVVVD